MDTRSSGGKLVVITGASQGIGAATRNGIRTQGYLSARTPCAKC